ncbi:hypothetical protein [Anaerotignum lactatifermentans]|uniref:hypothetical protein n=1 Tax=Anaerotignum lactatifermentans TaxID=160404 RepID=UPI00248E1FF6|nr:hypothetical protein [Anaerotignum lactatifermentans]
MVKHFALQSQLRCPRFFGVQSIHRHKNALKRAVFLVGSEFRLRVEFGETTPQEMRAAIYG